MLSRLTRGFAPLFALFLLTMALPNSAQAARIRSFDTVVRAGQDASLDVSETIVYDFEGANRHGIIQKIPVIYDRSGGTYTLKWEVQGVTDETGATQPYAAGREGRDLSIRVGDPNRTVSGVKTYVIKLRFLRAINWFNGAPEVYWNATGDQSQVPVEAATARFYPPPGVKISQIKTDSFRGPLGSKNRAQTTVESDSILFSARDLAPREGLTFVAGLPADSLTKPPAYQNLLWFAADWWSAFAFPTLAFVGMFNLWRARGRDIEGNLPAQVEWSPPKDMTPAEVGTLLNERCDMTDILSTLIDLAARGYLVIEDLSKKSLVPGTKIGAKTDYAFTRTDKPIPLDAPLRTHEQTFLRGLFGSTDPNAGRVTLESLKDQFYVHLPPIRESIYRDLTDKQFFKANPESTRQDYIGYGCLIGAVGVGALFMTGWLGTISYGIGLILAGIMVALWSGAMPARTALGSRKLRECVGFQRFVRLAEKDRIEKLITDDPTVFGRLLPYAMVLGVGEIWATKFSDLMSEAPDWYSSPMGGPFVPYLFVGNLGSGMNEMGTTFESQPSQSSGAGGSSSGFSDGGGFSGGGFGGGGVGDW